MGRRGGTLRIVCHQDGCRETTFVEYESQREGNELLGQRYYKEWKCSRHDKPERYLTPDNTANSVVLVATELTRQNYRGETVPLGMFWVPEGAASGSGYSSSPAHIAEAENFPAGTRLVVTAYVETQQQAALAASVDVEVSS